MPGGRFFSPAAPMRAKKKFWRKSSFNFEKNFPHLFLIIAPRHVERASEIEQQPEPSGFHPLGAAPAGKPAPIVSSSIPPVNCAIGIGVATVVFIGKSLTARGGQNPVEAILADRPVVFGPHMENFAALAHALVVHGAARQPNDQLGLTTTLEELFRDPEERARLVAAARGVLAPHRGATARSAALLEKLSAPTF